MFNKGEKIIKVPKGIRYISEWKEFELFNFPHVLDKKLPGCGFTEWCITNNQDVILCSPRKILLQNKKDQHEEVFLVVNEFEQIIDSGKDLESRKPPKTKSQVFDEDAKKEYFKILTHDLLTYIKGRKSQNKPVKILVTYDSFKLVYNILHYDLTIQNYQVIVDEWQSIFVDAIFKSSTEMTFMNYLKKVEKVCYVSATPMIEDYLAKINDFKFLPYYEFDWEALEPGRTTKPKITLLNSISVFTSAKKIINSYKDGKFEKIWRKVGDKIEEVESKEAVIFVNSVNNIISIVKQAKLLPDEVNILCAKTEENKKKIKRKLGKKFEIGKIPLRNEPRKMFTFCTRTVYLGADFYSTNARTFIISDANINTLAVDISLDLPQILGRQRLDENPWKNEATFCFRSILFKNKTTKEEFDRILNEKEEATEFLIKSFNDITSKKGKELVAEKYEAAIASENYKKDYVAVDKKFNTATMEYDKIPVKNELVMIAEQRAFDIQQLDYADRFTVRTAVGNVSVQDKLSEEITDFLGQYEKQPGLFGKLKYLCEYVPKSKDFKDNILSHISEKHFKEFYELLGPERCRALGYHVTRLKKELGIVAFDSDKLEKEIYKEFVLGNRYSLIGAKTKLSDIYKACGYNKAPKATDLKNWFETKSAKVVLSDGSTVNGLKLLNKKRGN